MDINKLPRIAFLLGAGASIHAGMPKTDEITERVLSFTNIGRHTDGSYYIDYNCGTSEQYLKRIRVMIGLLKEEVHRFYAKRQVDDGPPFNYEDLYYVARQIKDYAKGHTPLGGHPEILIGTYNKMIDYANEVFMDLRHMFYQTLLSTHHVIIYGYSFGDHGINKVLDSWIKLPDRRLVVVDPEAEKFKKRTSKWVESRIPECWDELKLRGILKCISKKIEDVSWEEIKKELH